MEGLIDMARSTGRPLGAIAQIPNRSGAMVNVTGPVFKQWRCSGCNTGGSEAGRSIDEAGLVAEAQGHADQCSAVAR